MVVVDIDDCCFTADQVGAIAERRIAQMRGLAARQGLDPDRWFNNVEIVAAESIGRETVQYVSNIYKYYLAYQMAVEQMKAGEEAKVGAS